MNDCTTIRRVAPLRVPEYVTWQLVRMGPHADVSVRHDHEATTLHRHEFDELVIVTGGFGVHVIDDEEFPLTRGDVFVLRGERVHGFRNVEELNLINVLFSREQFAVIAGACRDIPGFHALFVLEPHMRQTHVFKAKLHLSAAQLDRVMHLVGLLHDEVRKYAPGRALIIESLLRVLVVTLCRYYSTTTTGDSPALMRVSKAIHHLEHHFAEPQHLPTLARVAGMGLRTFSRAFKQTTGCSPITYLLRLRIERAIDLLANQATNVTAIAFAVGFESSSYFSQQFRKVMGVTPRSYLARQRPSRT